MRRWALLSGAVALLGCASAPVARPAAAAPVPPAAAPAGEDTVMTAPALPALVTELQDFLTTGPVQATALTPRFGSLLREGRSALYLQPADLALEQIIVSRARDTGSVRSVEVLLAQPAQLTVAALSRLFTTPATPPKVSFDAPTRLVYRWPAPPDRPLECRLSATLVAGASAEDGAIVRSLTLLPERR